MVVDDDGAFRKKVRDALGGLYQVSEAATEKAFRDTYQRYMFDLVILDMRLRTGREGLDLLREIQGLDELQPVIMVSAYGDTDATLASVESGALMFLHKQEFSPELIARMVDAVFRQSRMRRQLAALEHRVRQQDPTEIVGISEAVHRVTQLARRAADDPDSSVVIAGAPGTERELIARRIHGMSRRRASGPYVAASATIFAEEGSGPSSPGLTDGEPTQRGSELVRGADGGVLFLDGAEKIPLRIVDRLGRIISGRHAQLGDKGRGRAPDVQLVTGTVPTAADSVLRTIREALSGRPIVEIFLPPLRERSEDISLFAQYFLQTLRRAGQTSALTISKDALSALEAYDWPGNVQELKVAIEFAAIQAQISDSKELLTEYLPTSLAHDEPASSTRENWDYRFNLARSEVRLVELAIKRSGISNKKELAKVLGYNDRFAFLRRLKKNVCDFPHLGDQFPKAASLIHTRDAN